MSANNRQVGGKHYQSAGKQHWDFVAEHDLDYFQGQITKYVMRWKKKNGVQDLEKAQHFLEKYIEVAKKQDAKLQGRKAGVAQLDFEDQHGASPGPGYVNQD